MSRVRLKEFSLHNLSIYHCKHKYKWLHLHVVRLKLNTHSDFVANLFTHGIHCTYMYSFKKHKNLTRESFHFLAFDSYNCNLLFH